MGIRTLVLLGVWILAAGALAQQVSPAQLDGLINQQMARYKAPGLGFALIAGGKVVYSKGYGVRDIGSKTPVTPDTLFAVGSIAKPFTSLALMQQVAANKVRLDVPVVQYLPDLKFSDPQKGRKVTLRHLLSNASGLARYDAWVFDPSFDTAQKILGTVAQIPFASEPGSTFDYNNQNFVIAGAVLEKITGKPWSQYVRQNIFWPLGMSSQITFEEAVKTGNYAAPHSFTAKGMQVVPPFDRFLAIAPAGAIHASANDLARFLQFHLNAQQTLLPKALFNELHKIQVSSGALDLTQPASLNDIRGYGLGWFVGEYRGLQGFAHGGNITGFSSMIFALPKQQLGMVLLTNLGQANDFLDTTRLMLLEQIFNLQPRTDYSRIPAVQMADALSKGAIAAPDPAVLKPLAGRYVLLGGDSLEVVWEDEKLVLLQFGARIPITPLSQNLYLAELFGLYVVMEFQTDPSGVVWLKQNGQLAGVKASMAPQVAPR